MRRLSRGFSTVELMITVSIVLTIAGFSSVKIAGALKNARDTMALETTLSSLRLARQKAIDLRRQVLVQVSGTQTITCQRIDAGTPSVILGVQTLPSDAVFRAEPGIPTAAAQVPDGFGSGNRAIDFSIDYGGGGTVIYFQPDGSAQDVSGRVNNGVIYLARPGDLYSARAVTLYGATGRTRGWRLLAVGGGGYAWK